MNRFSEKKKRDPLYKIPLPQTIRFAAEGAALSLVFGYAFYRSFLAVLILLPAAVPYTLVRRKMYTDGIRRMLRNDFTAVLGGLTIALRAGLSADNAFRETGKHLSAVLGNEHPLTRETAKIVQGIRNNRPPEALFSAFAERTGIEEIRDLSLVFTTAKRMGGDLIGILGDASDQILRRIAVEREIETAVAGKKLEHRILSAVPCLLLLYMQWSAPEFLEVLYGNAAGVIMMTACLAVYGAAFMLGVRIVSIEV